MDRETDTTRSDGWKTAARSTDAPRADSYYSYSIRARRRSRCDWAGIGLEDAFRPSIDAVVRMTARRLFYDRVRLAQRAAARAGGAETRDWQPAVKAQIAPCYTTYPRRQAALAAIGMTAFLECMQHAAPGLVADACLADTEGLERLAQAAGRGVEVTAAVIRIAACAVEARLYCHAVARMSGLASIESYRLFLAAQHQLRFSTLREIVEAVVLFGDLLPHESRLAMHPVARDVLRDLAAASRPHLAGLCALSDTGHLEAGAAWTRSLARAALRHVSDPAAPAEAEQPGGKPGLSTTTETGGAGESGSVPELRLLPLASPPPPVLEDCESGERHPLVAALGRPGTPDDTTRAALEACARALRDACGVDTWEDPSSERIERVLRSSSFRQGPMEGDPVEGSLVQVPLADGATGEGELFECVMDDVAPRDDAENLAREAGPLARRIRRLLFPNLMPKTDLQRWRANGSLDPSRLAAAAFSDAVYRRVVTASVPDERGRPVVAIAADASGSLRPREARMIRLLMAAWIGGLRRRGVQLLCCSYTGDRVRADHCGPLLRWVVHPRKTAARSRLDTLRALASFTHGSGAQSDALSIRAVLDEARRLAAGRMVYLIVLTDGRFNRCFSTSRGGGEELRAMITRAAADMPLHSTLVVIGGEDVPDAMGCDALIRVTDDDLDAPGAVAEKIGLYVAAAIRERKRQTQRQEAA